MKHIHAELAALYAEDMMKSETPWENWEFKGPGGLWEQLTRNPSWITDTEYRRKTLTQKQVKEGWIEHTSNICPVDENSQPEVLLENGKVMKDRGAKSYDWRKDAPSYVVKIVAYKPTKTPLSSKDIPVGSFLNNGYCHTIIIAEICDSGVKYYEPVDGNISYIRYRDLMERNWTINRFDQRDKDGNPTTWSPCYK